MKLHPLSQAEMQIYRHSLDEAKMSPEMFFQSNLLVYESVCLYSLDLNPPTRSYSHHVLRLVPQQMFLGISV